MVKLGDRVWLVIGGHGPFLVIDHSRAPKDGYYLNIDGKACGPQRPVVKLIHADTGKAYDQVDNCTAWRGGWVLESLVTSDPTWLEHMREEHPALALAFYATCVASASAVAVALIQAVS